MRELLNTFYNVRTDAPESTQATPRTSLEEFADMLPHGSGLDGDWFVSVRRGGKGITLTTKWHAMDENGYYVGWFPVRIVLDRGENGLLSVRSVRINERYCYGVGDMLAVEMDEICKKA